MVTAASRRHDSASAGGWRRQSSGLLRPPRGSSGPAARLVSVWQSYSGCSANSRALSARCPPSARPAVPARCPPGVRRGSARCRLGVFFLFLTFPFPSFPVLSFPFQPFPFLYVHFHLLSFSIPSTQLPPLLEESHVSPRVWGIFGADISGGVL